MADKIVEGAGGTDSNGTTDFDRTRYFFTLPVQSARAGAVDQVGHDGLHDRRGRSGRRWPTSRTWSATSAGRAWRTGPTASSRRRCTTRSYPKDHPHHAAVIGSHADIQAATLTDVKGFFKTYYRPNNATLVLAGDFDKARAKQLIEKYFGPLKAGEPPPAVNAAAAEHHRREARGGQRPDRAAPGLPGLAHPRHLQARGRRARPGLAHPGRGQVEPPVQGAGLRQADRPGRSTPSSSR